MSDKYKDYVMTYSLNKLSETARTFRRLGDAYESTDMETDEYKGFSRQLFLVADILDDCMTMHLHTQELSKEQVHDIIGRGVLSGIRIRNIRMVTGRNGKKELILQARTMGKGCVSARKMEAILKVSLGNAFFPQDTNRIIINDEYHQYVYYQEDRFRILSAVARHSKYKNDLSGDNFLMQKLFCGKMVAAISDGCGSGKRAFVESRMVIELMENCIDAGFEEKTAIDLINAAYIAGKGLGNPVTMDMSIIDCQTGMLHCMKLGAVSTFIKRDCWVEIIKSTTLPMGVLEKADYDCTTKKLYDGDYVIMISDGILDNIPGVDKEEKMVDIINSISEKNPKVIASKILEKSLEYNKMEAFDDCTVLVLGLFDTYDN